MSIIGPFEEPGLQASFESVRWTGPKSKGWAVSKRDNVVWSEATQLTENSRLLVSEVTVCNEFAVAVELWSRFIHYASM